MMGRWLPVLFVLAGCSRPAQRPVPIAAPPVLPPVAAVSPWPGILRQAQQAADAGDYATADRLLAEFGVAHPKTPEGAEADFFRALYKADPPNAAATIREQLGAFDAYLVGGSAQPHYAEAIVLRRLLESTDSLRALVAAVRTTQDARARAREDEIRRLTDVLEKTTAELERIKRRLAKP
ncbi:MAG: hypothetical protein U0132_12355 [Gemmatimonadaceae bacterium]